MTVLAEFIGRAFDNVSWPKTSEMAYAGADAMLAERDKE